MKFLLYTVLDEISGINLLLGLQGCKKAEQASPSGQLHNLLEFLGKPELLDNVPAVILHRPPVNVDDCRKTT